MPFPFAAIPGLIGGAGLIGKGIAGLFGHHNKNPADTANHYLNQIPGQVNNYLGHYVQQGKEVNPVLQNQSTNMYTHPNDFYNQIGSGYKESPGYKFALEQALNAANNASSAGGMTGTGQHAQQNAQVASDIASQDYQKYIENVMNLLGIGQKGLQGLSDQGYGASTHSSDTITDTLGAQGQYGYAGQAGKNAGRESNWGNIFGGLAGLGGAFMPSSWGGTQYGNRG